MTFDISVYFLLDELMADWELAVSGEEPFSISPLQ
jgi:hypothetical protein